MERETFNRAKEHLTRTDLERIIERYRQWIASHHRDLKVALEDELGAEQSREMMETMEREVKNFRAGMDWWVGEDMVLGNLIPAAAKGDEVALAKLNEMRAEGRI